MARRTVKQVVARLWDAFGDEVASGRIRDAVNAVANRDSTPETAANVMLEGSAADSIANTHIVCNELCALLDK